LAVPGLHFRAHMSPLLLTMCRCAPKAGAHLNLTTSVFRH